MKYEFGCPKKGRTHLVISCPIFLLICYCGLTTLASAKEHVNITLFCCFECFDTRSTMSNICSITLYLLNHLYPCPTHCHFHPPRNLYASSKCAVSVLYQKLLQNHIVHTWRKAEVGSAEHHQGWLNFLIQAQ